MEHAIRHEINVRVEENPAFYQSLRERLEEIIEQQRLERLDAALVHNSRSRSTIVLYSRIRGSP